MTREEAIDILRSYLMFDKSNMQIDMALNMAIEALHREEAEAKGYCHRIKPKNDCNCDERREPLNGKSADIVIIDERREP